MVQETRDRRARISAKPGAKEEIYGKMGKDNILSPLYETGGLMFPYTPTLNDTATVNYDSYDPVHTNQPFMAFKNVAAKEITIIGMFTTMNQVEAAQNLANLHFLRTVTKMYFGVGQEPLGGTDSASAVSMRGTPPPILMFNAYGSAIYKNVPVIITNYNVEFPQDVDYVHVVNKTIIETPRHPRNTTGNAETAKQNLRRAMVVDTVIEVDAWLPTRFTISATLTVQNTPNRLRRYFNLNDFRTGALIKRGGWV